MRQKTSELIHRHRNSQRNRTTIETICISMVVPSGVLSQPLTIYNTPSEYGLMRGQAGTYRHEILAE